MYYIGNMACDPNYLAHYGVKGQVHGVRRYQNEDGSLTAEGREHYGVGGPRQETRGRDIYEKQQIRRMNRMQSRMAKVNNRYSEGNSERKNRRLDRKMSKYAGRYDEAQSNLERYGNASDKERRKARNSIRLKRAAVVGAAALAAYGAYSLTKANGMMKDHINDVKEYVKNGRGDGSPFRTSMREFTRIQEETGAGGRYMTERSALTAAGRSLGVQANHYIGPRAEGLKYGGASRATAGAVKRATNAMRSASYGFENAGKYGLAGAAAGAAGLGAAAYASSKSRKPLTKSEEARREKERRRRKAAASDFDGDGPYPRSGRYMRGQR